MTNAQVWFVLIAGVALVFYGITAYIGTRDSTEPQQSEEPAPKGKPDPLDPFSMG